MSEIYEAVCNLVYGDITSSPVPVAEVPFIQILILQKHHEVQQNYNFWFNRVRTTLAIVTGTDTYALPADYKEMIGIDPDNESSISEYELIGNNIIFTDEPTSDVTVQMDLWQYLPSPAAWDGTFTDYVTQYCHMAIIYAVTAMIMLKRSENSAAQAFMGLSEKSLESVYADDYGRRQSPGATF
jgi:hypothetical protein